MNDEQLAKIEQAATNATQGEWKTQDTNSDSPYVFADQNKGFNNPTICNLYDDVTPDDSVTCGAWYEAHDNAVSNAIHIATANPQAVLELINRLKAAENSDQHNFNRWQACEEKLREAEKDAANFKNIRSLCGYIENGSDTTFTLFQDDATKDWIVKVGNKTYYEPSLSVAIDEAMKGDAA